MFNELMNQDTSSRSLLSEADIEIAQSGRTPKHAVTVTCALKPPPAPAGRPCGRKPQSADRPCSAGRREGEKVLDTRITLRKAPAARPRAPPARYRAESR